MKAANYTVKNNLYLVKLIYYKKAKIQKLVLNIYLKV